MSSETKDGNQPKGPVVSRRGFMTSVGAGVVGVAISGKVATAETPDPQAAGKIKLNVNGREHSLAVEPRWTLLYVLRDKLGMIGTKIGCERGECGACTVLIDGRPRYSCLTLALEAEGHQITTIEGLMDGEKLGPVQQGFVEEDGMQCGYCTPGQVMSAEGLLRRNPHPGIEQIREGVSGNLCRCGAYAHIFRSVQRAADLREAGKTTRGGHD